MSKQFGKEIMPKEKHEKRCLMAALFFVSCQIIAGTQKILIINDIKKPANMLLAGFCSSSPCWTRYPATLPPARRAFCVADKAAS